MYPKARLDTLSDGIFGVAMTLLVLDLRLPEDFQPKDLFVGPGARSARPDAKVPALRDKFRRAWTALVVKCSPPFQGGILQPEIRGMVAALSSADNLRAAHHHRCWPFPESRALDLAVCRQHDPDFPGLVPFAGVDAVLRTKGPSARPADFIGGVDRLGAASAIGWSFINPRQAIWAFGS